tara:strand:- start:56741 stop:56872 length:132 start_codon:yes stop_codon:yes gene_type:complete
MLKKIKPKLNLKTTSIIKRLLGSLIISAMAREFSKAIALKEDA